MSSQKRDPCIVSHFGVLCLTRYLPYRKEGARSKLIFGILFLFSNRGTLPEESENGTLRGGVLPNVLLFEIKMIINKGDHSPKTRERFVPISKLHRSFEIRAGSLTWCVEYAFDNRKLVIFYERGDIYDGYLAAWEDQSFRAFGPACISLRDAVDKVKMAFEQVL